MNINTLYEKLFYESEDHNIFQLKTTIKKGNFNLYNLTVIDTDELSSMFYYINYWPPAGGQYTCTCRAYDLCLWVKEANLFPKLYLSLNYIL